MNLELNVLLTIFSKESTMKKHLVVVTLVAALFAANAEARRACGASSCEKPCAKPCAKACVDTICTKEVVNVPATQEVTRVVRTETKVGPIQCESCDCAAQHHAVTPDGQLLENENNNTQVTTKKAPRRSMAK